MDETTMIVCDGCGSVVHPEMLQVHSDWHDTLLTVKPLTESGPLANPDRTQVLDDITILPC